MIHELFDLCGEAVSSAQAYCLAAQEPNLEATRSALLEVAQACKVLADTCFAAYEVVKAVSDAQQKVEEALTRLGPLLTSPGVWPQ